MEIEFAPHVAEIKRALDNEIDESNITADLKKLLEYRVPLSEAKRSLIKKYGGSEKKHFKETERYPDRRAQYRKLPGRSLKSQKKP